MTIKLNDLLSKTSLFTDLELSFINEHDLREYDIDGKPLREPFIVECSVMEWVYGSLKKHYEHATIVHLKADDNKLCFDCVLPRETPYRFEEE